MIALTVVTLGAIGTIGISHAQSSADWTMSGRDIGNSRNQPAQTQLGVSNAGSLALKWSHTVRGDVSATPAVVNGAVYFPDWAGYLTKLDANTGALIWEHRIDAYAGEASGAISRTSPAVVNGVIYIGDQNGANLLAIDANTGNLNWSTLLSNGPSAIITQSPVVYNGVMFAGSKSGHMYAFNAATGNILWDYPGQGSANAGPAIDGNGTVYWGNGYSHLLLYGTGSNTFYAFSVNGK